MRQPPSHPEGQPSRSDCTCWTEYRGVPSADELVRDPTCPTHGLDAKGFCKCCWERKPCRCPNRGVNPEARS
jgi:hypothetical protein